MIYQEGLLEGRNSSCKARNPRAFAIAVKITKNQIAANGNGLETCRAPSCGLYFTLCNTYKYQPREMFLSWWYWSFTSWLRKKNKDAVKAIKKKESLESFYYRVLQLLLLKGRWKWSAFSKFLILSGVKTHSYRIPIQELKFEKSSERKTGKKRKLSPTPSKNANHL